MTQKDSSARTYLKIPVMVPVSGIFISIPGVRTPIPRVNTPAAVVGTAMTPATATPAAGLTPHRRSALDKSSDFPQDRKITIAEGLECPQLHMKPDMVPIGSDVIRVQSEVFVLGNEGIPNEGFYQNQYSIIIRKNPSLIQRKTSLSFLISPAKRRI